MPVASLSDRIMPTAGRPAGYAWLIQRLQLELPLPYELHAVANKQARIKQNQWVMHPSPRWPGDTVIEHLVFALKNEGVNLLVLKEAFAFIGTAPLASALSAQPGSRYLRRLAFLYEWLFERELEVPDSRSGGYVSVLDERQQYAGKEVLRSKRFRILDNMPGTFRFCPLIARTRTLDRYLQKDLASQAQQILNDAAPDLLSRAAAYLLLADSKASFEIEKERPTRQRIERWGSIIGKAGFMDLNLENLIALQKEVIGDERFVTLGLRREGGFIGEHDLFNQPVPAHISANHQDLPDLIEGIIAYDEWSEDSGYHPVLSAAALSFGFVYIHPFEDGNGRIHRFLLHHVLAHRGYTPKEIIFPISNAILKSLLLQYRTTLESWSKPLLPFIDWVATRSGNVEVRNETADYYRYFDATPHAEFIFACLERTIEEDLPQELRFLETRDRFHKRATEIVDMPERTIDLLFTFLRQGDGSLSRRALKKEFALLTAEEVGEFEDIFRELTTRE